jgi:hypothetical protein
VIKLIFESFHNNPREYLFEHYELMIQGIATLIYLGICIIIALKFLKAYLQYHEKPFLYAGCTFICITATWSGHGLNFLSVLLFNVIPPNEVYFLMHGGTTALGLFCWIMTITDLTNIEKRKRKIIHIFSGIICLIIQIIYISIIFTDTRLLGYLIAPTQMVYTLISQVYLGFILIMFEILGLWLVKASLQSEVAKNRLKGKLLFVSFMLFLFGCILEIFFKLIQILIIARILVLISALFFYFGFILPKWIQKIFEKDNKL